MYICTSHSMTVQKKEKKKNLIFCLKLSPSRRGCLHLHAVSVNKSIDSGEFAVSFETFGSILGALFSF